MFKLTKPCDNCPFRIEGGIRLHPERAREIANCFVQEPGATFPCHKTVDYSEADEDGEAPMTRDNQMCAGGLILSEHFGRPNNMLRMAMRLGLYDPDKLDRASFSHVFNSVRAMVSAQRKPRKKNRA